MYLKPCPFCGFQPYLDDKDCLYPVNRARTTWRVRCYESGGGCSASVLADTPAGAVNKWNRRYSESGAGDPSGIETAQGSGGSKT